MSTNTASGVPPPTLIVSSRDFDRLEQLLDAPVRAGQPAAVALMEELRRADVLNEDEMPDTVVTMGSVVQCVDETSAQQHTLTLVYPHEANADEGRISILTPVGSALLGLSLGQVIDWAVPGSPHLRLRVTAIQRRPQQ